MVAYLFPGQSAQHRGMGKALFEEFPELTREADEILGYSIRELCLTDPERRLNQTQYTQPALYVVNALSHYRLERETGRRPDALAGHSLGEYNALLAAGCFDFGTGLRLVKKRGELMAAARNGGMAAVLNLREKEVRDILRDAGLDGIDVANLNAPTQVVLSGIRADIDRAQGIFERNASCRYVILQVSGAFHSRYMVDAQREFADCLAGFDIAAPMIPVVANVTARFYRPDEVQETLTAQIASAVKWSEGICYLLGRGESEFVEVGPGKVLTGLLSSIRRDAEPLIIDDEQPIPVPVAVPTPRTVEPAAVTGERIAVQATELGSASFRRDYGLRYACLIGSMFHGISSVEMVAAVARAGMLGVLGTARRTTAEIAADLRRLRQELAGDAPYAVNVTFQQRRPEATGEIVDLLLAEQARVVEASGFITITADLVRYRLAGAYRNDAGDAVAPNRIIAKVSRPEVAAAFLDAPPPALVQELLAAGRIGAEEAALAAELSVAEDLCCAADSGGPTDQTSAFSLVPAMARRRDAARQRSGNRRPIRLGVAGGIGSPEAAAACLMMGADFIVTGSINQCTVEAATSDTVKDLLQNIDIQDTGYAPAGDTLEYGAKVQVLRKGVLFPPRANKLYELFKRHESLDDIDPATAEQIQNRYFGKSFGEVWGEVRTTASAHEVTRAERDPKQKMGLVFRWYFDRATALAVEGSDSGHIDFQVYCGSALGSFNRWVEGTDLENWRQRHVGEINRRLLEEAADVLNRRFASVGTE